MQFRYEYRYTPNPDGPSQYLMPMTVDIECWTPSLETVIAGRLAMDYLDLLRISSSSESLYDVCDSDSAGWEAVCDALLDTGTEELREDLEFEDPIFFLLFLYRAVFHPSLTEWRSYILYHTLESFRTETAMVMWKTTTELPDHELSQLGFRIVAGRDLLFRPGTRKSEYDEIAKTRSPLDLYVPEDAGQYVNSKWQNIKDRI